MTLQISTQTKAALLAAFAGTFNGGVIRVFSGVRPAYADMAETGTYLGSITKNGYPPSMGVLAGLTFTQSGPYITNDAFELWSLGVEQAGTATWFRVVGPASDAGGVSYSLPRIDGDIAADGSKELRLPSVTLGAGDVVSPIQFLYTFPPIIGS